MEYPAAVSMGDSDAVAAGAGGWSILRSGMFFVHGCLLIVNSAIGVLSFFRISFFSPSYTASQQGSRVSGFGIGEFPYRVVFRGVCQIPYAASFHSSGRFHLVRKYESHEILHASPKSTRAMK